MGRFDSIDAKAAEGTSALELRDRVAAAVPPGVEVVTSQQVADEGADAVQQALGFFSTALLVFAAQGAVMWRVGLVVGVCNLVGSYLGARTAVSRGSRFVQVFFVLVVAAFIVKIGADVVRDL